MRTRKTPEAVARAAENAVNSQGRDNCLGTRTVDEEVSQALVEDRAIAILSSIFGMLPGSPFLSQCQAVSQAQLQDHAIARLSRFFCGLALLLDSIGLYGLMSYSISRRTREIGVRAALGAQRPTILWLILREALALVLLGVAVGIPFALAASRLIASMLFGISPGDLPTIAAVLLLLVTSALVAGYVPARRASNTDPVIALRTE